MAYQDAKVVNQFRDIAVSRLEDVLAALPALVPQSQEDKMLFRRGMKAIDELVYDMKHAESIRELSRYLDIEAILKDYDEDSIRTLNSQIDASARTTIEKLSDLSLRLGGYADEE